VAEESRFHHASAVWELKGRCRNLDAVAVEAILKRDKLVVGGGLIALTLIAWCYMAYEAHGMNSTGICCCAGMKMSGPDKTDWDATRLLPLFLMWAEMMVAMMIPSAAPMILTFASVNRKRRERAQPFVPTFVFVSGYLLVWTAFSLAAALAQWIFHSMALLSPKMVSTSPVLAGVLLGAAGVFQWTHLKGACLRHCRTPLSFLMTQWQEGYKGALVMGLRHGTFCTGCCWALMALLFVSGVMNMWWIAVITSFVLVEKLALKGLWVGRAAGILLCGWGVWNMAQAFVR
jgi:predicted metal-binding membrane protein